MITAKEAKEISDRVGYKKISDMVNRTITEINKAITSRSKEGFRHTSFKIESPAAPESSDALIEIKRTLEEYGYTIEQVKDDEKPTWIVEW